MRSAALAAISAAFLANPAGYVAYAADQYEIDAAHTHVQFSVRRFGFNDVIGFFPDVSGVVTLDHEAPEKSRVEAEIGVASLVSGDATRNEHVLGEFWLNAGAFPVMRFRSTSVKIESENQATVTGDLTLLGETLPVELDVTLNKLGADPATKREAAGFSATGLLKRSDFGSQTALGLVGDEVSIRIETLAHKKADD